MRHIYILILLGCSLSAFGQIDLNTNFQPNIAAPLDLRYKIASLADTASIPFAYQGAITYVTSKDSVYYRSASGWTPIGSSAGISTEIDPTVDAHIKAITATDIANWNNDLVNDADADPTNELQDTSNINGLLQFVQNHGGDGIGTDTSGTYHASIDLDLDPTNELFDSIYIYAALADTAAAIRSDFPAGFSGSWNDLTNIPAGFADNIDNVNDPDADPTNELQTLSPYVAGADTVGFILSNTLDTIELIGAAGGVTGGVNTDNQTLLFNSPNLSITGGNSVDLSALQDGTGTDNQTLSIVGSNLTISGGNTVTLPSGGGGGSSNITYSYQTADQSNSTTTLGNSGIALSLTSGDIYALACTYLVNGGTNEDINHRYILPSSNNLTYTEDLDGNSAASFNGNVERAAALITGQNRIINHRGIIDCTSSGTLTFQFAQNNAGANAAVMKRGSYCRLEKLN